MNRIAGALHIELSSTCLRVTRTTRWLRPVREFVAQRALDDASPDAALQALAGVLADAHCTGLRTTAVIGNEWSRLFMATAPRNAESRRDCDAAVQLRSLQLFGDSASAWTVRADHDASHPFLACAVSERLLEGLQRIGHTQRLTWMSIRPQFLAAWNRWCAKLEPGDWFGMVDAHALTLAMLGDRWLADVRRLALPSQALGDGTWPLNVVTREALRLCIAPPSRLRLCGAVPAPWLAPSDSPLCVPLDAVRAEDAS